MLVRGRDGRPLSAKHRKTKIVFVSDDEEEVKENATRAQNQACVTLAAHVPTRSLTLRVRVPARSYGQKLLRHINSLELRVDSIPGKAIRSVLMAVRVRSCGFTGVYRCWYSHHTRCHVAPRIYR